MRLIFLLVAFLLALPAQGQNIIRSQRYATAACDTTMPSITLTRHFMADTGVYEDNGKVTAATDEADPVCAWEPVTGTGDFLSNTSVCPSLDLSHTNGHDAVTFDGTEYMWSSTAEATVAQYNAEDTVVVIGIWYQGSDTNSETLYFLGDSTQATIWSAALDYETDNAAQTMDRAGTATRASTGSNTFQVADGVVMTYHEWVGQVYRAVSIDDGTLATWSGTDTGHSGTHSTAIGTLNNSSPGAYLEGGILELITIYDNRLTASEITEIWDSRSCKYGL